MQPYDKLQAAALKLAVDILMFEERREGTVPMELKRSIANVTCAALDIEEMKEELRQRLTDVQNRASI